MLSLSSRVMVLFTSAVESNIRTPMGLTKDRPFDLHLHVFFNSCININFVLAQPNIWTWASTWSHLCSYRNAILPLWNYFKRLSHFWLGCAQQKHTQSHRKMLHKPLVDINYIFGTPCMGTDKVCYYTLYVSEVWLISEY